MRAMIRSWVLAWDSPCAPKPMPGLAAKAANLAIGNRCKGIAAAALVKAFRGIACARPGAVLGIPRCLDKSVFRSCAHRCLFFKHRCAMPSFEFASKIRVNPVKNRIVGPVYLELGGCSAIESVLPE